MFLEEKEMNANPFVKHQRCKLCVLVSNMNTQQCVCLCVCSGQHWVFDSLLTTKRQKMTQALYSIYTVHGLVYNMDSRFPIHGSLFMKHDYFLTSASKRT